MGQDVGGIGERRKCVRDRNVQRHLVGVLFNDPSIRLRVLPPFNQRSFIGYSNANYALSEIRDPVRTIKRAAPLAILTVTIVYMFVNVAYFSAVSKTDILESRRIVA